jgi:hypothetical protein
MELLLVLLQLIGMTIPECIRSGFHSLVWGLDGMGGQPLPLLWWLEVVVLLHSQFDNASLFLVWQKFFLLTL